MIFGNPGRDLIDQVLKDCPALTAPARAHAVSLYNGPLHLLGKVFGGAFAKRLQYEHPHIVFADPGFRPA